MLNLWWGYIHQNGKVNVKRFFDQKDVTEASTSDFVATVFLPRECKDREDALRQFNNEYDTTQENETDNGAMNNNEH